MSAQFTSAEPAPNTRPEDDASVLAQMRPALLKYFKRKCGNSAEAEDLTQDVLVRTLAHARWRSTDQARGYVFRAAVNRWRDHLRRRVTHGRSVNWDDAAAYAVHEETAPERVLGGEQELHRVVAALQELSERTRDVFMLIRLEQMKQEDVAEMFGISVSAVQKHVVRALAHLARCAARDDASERHGSSERS